MKIKSVIFDLDGTLLNTLGDLSDSVNAAIVRRGYPATNEEDVRARIGDGIGKLIERSLPDTASRALIESCLDDFRTAYEQRMMNRTQPYDGIVPLLRQLRQQDVTIGVLSNKYDLAAKTLVRHYFGDLAQYTLGERPNVPRKPDPTSAREMIRLLDASPAETLYVGDSAVDMQTAKNAGLTAVGVTWGFRSAEVLTNAGADVLIHHPAELLPLLQGGVPDLGTVTQNLTRNGFDVHVCATAAEARDYLTAACCGKTVTFGGSQTLQTLGAAEALRGKAQLHWHALDPQDYTQNPDIYVCSANAVSATGELVNIDGRGNRVAGTLFGATEKVIFVCGINKLCPDLGAAARRAREVAAPANAKRLGCKTPCAVDGKCHDCHGENRICRAMVVHFGPMRGTPCEVVLVTESLGF